MTGIVDFNLTEELEHGIYVSRLARELGRDLELPEDMIYELQVAGLLHDIGKLRLVNYLYGNEAITSPLLVEEMKYVRMHPMLSYEILKGRDYSPFILDCVRYHHENYDGSGFPSNLVGEEIPFGARILRVCDVFAALTAHRPYRKRFEVGEAISLMIDEVSHFDMRIFLAFDRVVHKAGAASQFYLADNDVDLMERFVVDLPFPLKDADSGKENVKEDKGPDGQNVGKPDVYRYRRR